MIRKNNQFVHFQKVDYFKKNKFKIQIMKILELIEQF